MDSADEANALRFAASHVIMERFAVEKKLGSGSFGSVFLVRRRNDGKMLALKRVAVSSRSELKMVLREVDLLANLRHPNIVAYVEAFAEGPNAASGQAGASCVVGTTLPVGASAAPRDAGGALVSQSSG